MQVFYYLSEEIYSKVDTDGRSDMAREKNKREEEE